MLLDGFPRINEHIEVAATLGAVKGVIFLDAPEDVLECSRDPLVCDARDTMTIREEYRRRQVMVCI